MSQLILNPHDMKNILRGDTSRIIKLKSLQAEPIVYSDVFR
jgi:hypothetical protein